MRSTALLAAIAFLCATAAHAQAWTKEKGKAYVKLAYGSSTASEQYTFDGRTKEYADNVEENSFFDRSIYFYGELGLTKDLTLVANLPYKRVILRDAAYRYRTFGPGDARLGVRYGLNGVLGLEGGADAVATNVTLSLPMLYTRNLAPSAGAGQVNAELNLAYGRSFHPFPGYAQAALGYRYRSRIYGLSRSIGCAEGVNKDCVADAMPSYEDEIFGGVEAGVTLFDRVLVQGIAQINWAVTEPTVGFTVQNPIPTSQRFIKTGGGVAARVVGDLALSAQFFWTPYGRNTVKSFDLFLGVDYTFAAF